MTRRRKQKEETAEEMRSATDRRDTKRATEVKQRGAAV